MAVEPSTGQSSDVGAVDRKRRRATVQEAKALGHPLRARILTLCGREELTNKQLASRLDRDPGTTLYHVKLLVEAGFLEPAPVRTGPSGALEKPYRSTGRSWWLSDPLADAAPGTKFLPIESFLERLDEAGPDSVATYATFPLHLSDEDVAELDRRILAVIDSYIESDHERQDRPVHAGLVLLHRLAR